LLLDNFEHVIEVSPLLVELLEACPELKLLITSREVLRLRAEHQFVVPPLALPTPGTSQMSDRSHRCRRCNCSSNGHRPSNLIFS
jgi:predicted ATPase